MYRVLRYYVHWAKKCARSSIEYSLSIICWFVYRLHACYIRRARPRRMYVCVHGAHRPNKTLMDIFVARIWLFRSCIALHRDVFSALERVLCICCYRQSHIQIEVIQDIHDIHIVDPNAFSMVRLYICSQAKE